MSNSVTPRDADAYWFARGDTRLHTGITEVGLTTTSGAAEFKYGTKEEVAALLDRYKAELPEETSLSAESGGNSRRFVKDAKGDVKWVAEADDQSVRP